MSPELEKLHDELATKINEYFIAVFKEFDDYDEGDYVDGWVLSVHYKNIEDPLDMGGYMVEAFPAKSPLHVVKGLLREGIEEVRTNEQNRD